MRVKGLAWVGIQTDRFEDMQAMLAAVLGVPPPVQEEGFALWSLPNGDLVELFANGTKPTFGMAPVVGFQVDDLEAARKDAERAGAVVVGGYGPNDDGYASLHLRAPDGTIFELVLDPAHETRSLA